VSSSEVSVVKPSESDLVISVRDTGAGLDEPLTSRVFEPSFATRAEGGRSRNAHDRRRD
jgi:signal transduction histidine kinase